MKWYDYVVCFFLADMISALLMAGNILVVFPVLVYFQYENYRTNRV
jgi:hypothetical protein